MGFFTNNLVLEVLFLCSLPILLLIIKTLFIYRYWKKKRVTNLKPTFPFGNFKELVLFQKPFHYVNKEFYEKFKHEMKQPFGGVYNMLTPVLIACDPDFIKQVLIKDFDHFVDRGLALSDEKVEPLQGHLFNKEGHDWRKLRNKLSPTFTSGKIKCMLPLIKTCSNNLVKTIDGQLEKSDIKEISLDIKDYCARYTTDVIGSTAFGLEINSLENPDSEFRRVSSLVLKPTLSSMFKSTISMLIPNLKKFITIKTFNSRLDDFFYGLVKTNLSYREKNDIKRDDFLNLMLQLKKEQLDKEIGPDDLEITDDVIAAQTFVFFFAGFETSSTVLSFCLYELAKNQTIQSKLREEIAKTKKEFGEFTYEAYQKMTYLDKVSKEALRKYPSLPQLDRITNQDYQIPNTDIVLDAGTKVCIPIFAIHYDPEYYPDPEIFDPERFSPENVEARPHYTYLPFGDGPRNCIGMRFGIVQFKCGLVHLIENFEFSIDAENKKLEYLTGSLLLQSSKPFYLNIKPVSH